MADMPVISFYPRLPHGVSPLFSFVLAKKGRKMGSLPAKGADNLGIPRRAHRAGGIAGGGGAA